MSACSRFGGCQQHTPWLTYVQSRRELKEKQEGEAAAARERSLSSWCPNLFWRTSFNDMLENFQVRH